jgi:NAD(P)H-nitrite reductase large subunit
MRHVIIGGGPAGMYAPAYSRMALPYYLAREIPEEHVLLGNERFFEEMRVDALLGRRVTAINPEQKALTLDDGGSLSFDTLLIATGSSPTRPGIPGADGSKVTTLWTLQESQDVLSHTIHRGRVHRFHRDKCFVQDRLPGFGDRDPGPDPSPDARQAII